jgi:hypothetical protein
MLSAITLDLFHGGSCAAPSGLPASPSPTVTHFLCMHQISQKAPGEWDTASSHPLCLTARIYFQLTMTEQTGQYDGDKQPYNLLFNINSEKSRNNHRTAIPVEAK